MVKDRLIDRSRGDGLGWFWRLYRLRQKTKNRLVRSFCTYLMCRSAHRHGGYVGPGAEFASQPVLPHGLHGVFISRYAVVGARCKIYQNVTIGEVDGKAPVIGQDCLIGAGAVLVGDIRVGRGVRIGAGAVVSRDVPDCATVVSQPPRVMERGDGHGVQYDGHRPGLAGD